MKEAVEKSVEPAAALTERENQQGRRKFVLTSLAAGAALLVSSWTSGLSGILRGLFPNLLPASKNSFRAGKAGEYKIGQVDGRWLASHRLWVVRTLEGIYALKAVCTHGGCTVEWSQKDQQFRSSCGSGFYKSGIHFEGPAKRPLERVSVTLADGEIFIDPSKKFLQEKGEWAHPASLLRI